MSDASDLESIGRRHGSDKWAGHFYAEPYALHLGPLRAKPISLLEIGVGGYNDPNAGGQSLRAWKEFFPKARVCGLDFHDKSGLSGQGFQLHVGSQADPCTIAKIIESNPEGFDVIIDDGSHRSEHVISTFYMLWQHVKNDGYYIVEDLQTSYWPSHGGQLNISSGRMTSMSFLKGLVDGLNWQEVHQPTYSPSSFDQEITGISFYHNMAFIRKGRNTEGSTEVFNNRIPGV